MTLKLKTELWQSAGLMVEYTPAANLDSGTPVAVGAGVRIPHDDLTSGKVDDIAAAWGVYKGAKSSAVIVDGDAIFWDADGDPVSGTAGSGCYTNVAAGNVFAGMAVAAAGSTDEEVVFLHLPVTDFAVAGIAKQVADPGNAGAIPVTSSGHVQIVTTAAQTRTIAAPSFVGQELLLCLKTDGGDCVITVATGINQAGNTTITMNDAGDSIRLNAIQNGSNIRWRVVYNDGCTLA